MAGYNIPTTRVNTADAVFGIDPSTGAPVNPNVAPKDAIYKPLGYQQIVGLAASTALTVPTEATYAIITCENQIVRWRDDGVAPTASVGMQLSPNSSIWYDASLSEIRFIQTAATATLNVSYYS